MSSTEPCPVCRTPDVSNESSTSRRRYQCPRCGDYFLSSQADEAIVDIARTRQARAVLSYAIRRMPRPSKGPPTLWSEDVERLVRETKLPDPLEQLDNLVVWLGENTESGTYVEVDDTYQALVGVASASGLSWVVQSLCDVGILLEGSKQKVKGIPSAGAVSTHALSPKGWERYRELKRSAEGSRKAFMAMQYGDPELNRMFYECFRPAVAATGFTLRLCYEDAKAGNIDDQMRTDLLTSRFTVADLTHDNRGAYWEAGFAEGAGRPVIYTCKKGHIPAVHFDTNHHLIVEWDPNDLPKTAAKLKATVRATLPAEAKLEDD